MAAKKSKAKAAPHKPEQRDLLTTIIEKSKPEAKPSGRSRWRLSHPSLSGATATG